MKVKTRYRGWYQAAIRIKLPEEYHQAFTDAVDQCKSHRVVRKISSDKGVLCYIHEYGLAWGSNIVDIKRKIYELLNHFRHFPDKITISYFDTFYVAKKNAVTNEITWRRFKEAEITDVTLKEAKQRAAEVEHISNERRCAVCQNPY